MTALESSGSSPTMSTRFTRVTTDHAPGPSPASRPAHRERQHAVRLVEHGVQHAVLGRGCAAAVPPSETASTGSNTSTSAENRSSTTSQPTAILPASESNRPRSINARTSTTVLATESASPSTMPAPRLQPKTVVATMVSAGRQQALDRPRPGSRRSGRPSDPSIEKCIPTPNIRNATPISPSCSAVWTSATWPGRVRAHRDAGQQEPDDRRQPQPQRDQPADQAERQRERQLVHQAQRLVGVPDLLDDLLPNLLNP